MKKDLYKKSLTYAIILILISVAVVPSINASVAKISTNEDEEVTTSFGSIHGTTMYLLGWGMYGLPFALVKAEADGITHQDRSNIFTIYRISRLPLGKTYTVTASSDLIIELRGKYYELVSESVTITLTADNPVVEKHFALEIDYDNPVKDKKEDKLSVDQTIQKIFQRFPIVEKLFSSTFFCSNTRSNFLSTTAFFM